ncbi:MAG: hypothetical protein VZS44_00515 [Bacilli bacterium]|nr:hypothetical protein [Bacilli bacterium]
MKFYGISRVFLTINNEQYKTIGAFWDELSEKYGMENLRGLGYNWTNDSIEYVIGLKDGIIADKNIDIDLPDEGWIIVKGSTNDLSKIYEDIYKDGPLKYEIEMFNNNGTCEIWYFR